MLREGLDLPEVALVAIMDADLESFLRDKRSLIQIIGRAARNTESKVIFYGDKITKSMQAAIDETERRRKLQEEYNQKHGILPKTVTRDVIKSITNIQKAIAEASKSKKKKEKVHKDPKSVLVEIADLEQKMQNAADNLDFELAISLRSKLNDLKDSYIDIKLENHSNTAK